MKKTEVRESGALLERLRKSVGEAPIQFGKRESLKSSEELPIQFGQRVSWEESERLKSSLARRPQPI